MLIICALRFCFGQLLILVENFFVRKICIIGKLALPLQRFYTRNKHESKNTIAKETKIYNKQITSEHIKQPQNYQKICKIAKITQLCEKYVKIHKKRKVTPKSAKVVIFIKKLV